MATHSSTLAWKIPWLEEPGGLQSMGSQRVGRLSNFTSLHFSGKEPACQGRRHKRHGFDPCVSKIPWRRAQQPTPAFLPGESHGQRSLAGYSLWGRKGSDTTEQLTFNFMVRLWTFPVKNPPANAGNSANAGSIPGSGRSPGGGHGSLLQYSCLENPMDREAWRVTVHGVTKTRTQLKRLSSSSSSKRY